MHFLAHHHRQNPAVHLYPHFAMARLLKVLLAIDTVVLHPEGVALVVEGGEVLLMIHTFHDVLTRDRDYQDVDVEGGDGRTLIQGRHRGLRQGGEEEDHYRGAHRGGDGEARATARIAATARVEAEVGADL